MIYLDELDLETMGVDWSAAAATISRATQCLRTGDFAQPIKPYLRYRDPSNRIIAMPAFVGGAVEAAGLKWIASFPDNQVRGLPRAHSLVVLNDPATGEPFALINGARLSVIRTAAVSAAMALAFRACRPRARRRAGITGWGPIGQAHADMLAAVFGRELSVIRVYDPRKRLGPASVRGVPVEMVDRWQDAYVDADVFATCTVARERYIDLPPATGSLQLNVSLRDYTVDVLPFMRNAIVVDSWDEVCREDTDIERFHRMAGLSRDMTYTIVDALCGDVLAGFPAEDVVMFNPMGMAVFDVAIAAACVANAQARGLGRVLARRDGAA